MTISEDRGRCLEAVLSRLAEQQQPRHQPMPAEHQAAATQRPLRKVQQRLVEPLSVDNTIVQPSTQDAAALAPAPAAEGSSTAALQQMQESQLDIAAAGA